MNAIKKLSIPRDPVPIEWWGKDHWNTLVYIETRCVDYDGVPNHDHMRIDIDRHDGMVGVRQGISSVIANNRKYPTRLRDGIELMDHDDWDCAEDAEKLGLIINKGSGINPVYEMTDKGHALTARLRAHKSRGGNYSNFEPGTI